MAPTPAHHGLPSRCLLPGMGHRLEVFTWAWIGGGVLHGRGDLCRAADAWPSIQTLWLRLLRVTTWELVWSWGKRSHDGNAANWENPQQLNCVQQHSRQA